MCAGTERGRCSAGVVAAVLVAGTACSGRQFASSERRDEDSWEELFRGVRQKRQQKMSRDPPD